MISCWMYKDRCHMTDWKRCIYHEDVAGFVLNDLLKPQHVNSVKRSLAISFVRKCALKHISFFCYFSTFKLNKQWLSFVMGMRKKVILLCPYHGCWGLGNVFRNDLDISQFKFLTFNTCAIASLLTEASPPILVITTIGIVSISLPGKVSTSQLLYPLTNIQALNRCYLIASLE